MTVTTKNIFLAVIGDRVVTGTRRCRYRAQGWAIIN